MGNRFHSGLDRDSAATLALQALAYIMSEEALRDRFLDLSGVSPNDLRHGLESDAVLAAILAFLASHEPDLVACAIALGQPPEQLMNAAHMLQGEYE
jgi:hypothetical protein